MTDDPGGSFSATALPSFVIQIRAPGFLDPPQPPCLNDGTRAQITALLGDLLREQFPDTFVDVLCLGDEGQPPGQAATFGVWVRGPRTPGAQHLAQMRAALAIPIGREPEDMVAFSFSHRFLDILATEAVGDGGSTHVHSAWTELRPPDTVLTRASGVDESAVPDAHFTATITETLALHGSEIADPDTRRSLDVDNSAVYDILAAAAILTRTPSSPA